MFCSVPFMFLLFENIYLKHPINFQVGKFHQRNFWSQTSNSHITTGNFQPQTTQKKRHLNPNSSELFEKIMESKAHKREDSCDWKGFLSCPSIFMFCSVPFMFLLFENIYLKHPINFQVGKFHQRNFWSRTSNSHITTGNFQPLTTQKTALKS